MSTTEAPPQSAGARRLLENAQRSFTHAPLVWAICGSVVAAALVVTAVTGGFAEAPARVVEVPVLAAGDEHRNDRFAIAVASAELVSPKGGENTLDIELTLTNLSPEAFSATGALRETFVVPGIGEDDYVTAVRTDDGTRMPWVQPGIPVTMTLSWDIEDARKVDYTGLDTLRISLLDPRPYTLSAVGTGSSWNWVDPVLGAYVDVDLEGGP